GEISVLTCVRSVDIPIDDPQVPTSGRRLAYARHLTSGNHPLLARVLVNRVWIHHFGKGIVATPGNFGFLGERPSHPELLEWLASTPAIRQDDQREKQCPSAKRNSVAPSMSRSGDHCRWECWNRLTWRHCRQTVNYVRSRRPRRSRCC